MVKVIVAGQAVGRDEQNVNFQNFKCKYGCLDNRIKKSFWGWLVWFPVLPFPKIWKPNLKKTIRLSLSLGKVAQRKFSSVINFGLLTHQRLSSLNRRRSWTSTRSPGRISPGQKSRYKWTLTYLICIYKNHFSTMLYGDAY